MQIGLIVVRMGSGDDSSLALVVKKNDLRFTSTIFLSQQEIERDVHALRCFSQSLMRECEEPELELQFGVFRLRDVSPTTLLRFHAEKPGSVRVTVEMSSLPSGNEMLDRCAIHFYTDLTSIDRFTDQFSALAFGSQTTAAELIAFEK